MNQTISLNTKAILLLTAPLLISRKTNAPPPLTLGEYKRLTSWLLELKREPADLLGDSSNEVIQACCDVIDASRLRELLDRGFQLGTAIEQWRARSIWVVSRADSYYPRCLKTRLRENAPPVLYGVGNIDLLCTGGLAVVGSRHVDSGLIDYTMGVGRLCAQAGKTVITGVAKGIDKAAMHGALEAGGTVVGVLANNLERAALHRDHRNPLLEERLVLVSPYDPGTRFNVGNAMQRNKLIYAFAEAALVVNADFNKGGTWSGAVEQLDKLKFVPLYVRATGQLGKGLKALRDKGAYPWPDPQDAQELDKIFNSFPGIDQAPHASLPPDTEAALTTNDDMQMKGHYPTETFLTSELGVDAKVSLVVEGTDRKESSPAPAVALMDAVQKVILQVLERGPKNADEIATELQVSLPQTRTWLSRLVDKGLIKKETRPVRYVINQRKLFDI